MAIPLSSMEILMHSRHENIVWILNIGTMRVFPLLSEAQILFTFRLHKYTFTQHNYNFHDSFLFFFTGCLSSQNEKIQGKAH